METPEPRWLTDEERQTWLALVGMTIRLPTALDAQLQRDAGISHFEYVVMAMLSEAPDRTMRMSDLAVFVNGSLSRLSHVANRLEKRGWLRRAPDPQDGRSTVATLTKAGLDKVVETAPGHVEAVRSLVFDPLTQAQMRQLDGISRRILAAINAGDSSSTLPPWPDSSRDSTTA